MMTSQERYLKIIIIIIIIIIITKIINNKFIWSTKSRVIHVRVSIPKQYQMIMSSVARVKFTKTNVIFRYHTKGVSNQVSSYSDYEIKSYSCSNSSTKVRKTKKWKKFPGLQNGAMRWLQFGAGFRDYKSG